MTAKQERQLAKALGAAMAQGGPRVECADGLLLALGSLGGVVEAVALWQAGIRQEGQAAAGIERDSTCEAIADALVSLCAVASVIGLDGVIDALEGQGEDADA